MFALVVEDKGLRNESSQWEGKHLKCIYYVSITRELQVFFLALMLARNSEFA